MPFTNFDSRHFSTTEQTALDAAITEVENALAGKLASLTTEERRQYGSVNERNKLVINKVYDYNAAEPALSSADVDWAEFAKDYTTRSVLENTIQRLQSIIDGLGAAKLLHDWDNYQAALIDYEYTKYKNGSGAIGYATKVKELAQFFGGGTTPPAPPAAPTQNAPE